VRAPERLTERARALFETVLAQDAFAFVVVDAQADDMPILFVNAEFERVTGHPAAEVVGRNCRFLQGPDTDPQDVARLREGIAAAELTTVTLRNHRRDGTPFWNRVVVAPVREDGEVVLFAGVVADVSEHVEAVHGLRAAERRNRRLVEGLPLVTYELVAGPEGPRLTFVSPQVERMSGFPPERWLGSASFWISRLHPEDRDRVLKAQHRRWEDGETIDLEYRLCAADGRTIWVWEQDAIVEGDGPPARDGFLVDITAVKSAEAVLAFQATHDQLTALPNRALLVDRLEHALHRAARSGEQVGVLFVDLDGFKVINDSLGHGAGDSVLRACVPRLRDVLREADTLARFGGDEFVVVCEDAGSAADVSRVARRIVEAFRDPIEVAGSDHVVTASVGVAMAEPEHGAAAAIRDADAAMYEAKRQGRNRFELFDRAMREAVVRRLALERALRGAVERGELSLVYQPIVELVAGRPTSLEALLRWTPADGPVSPAELIPVAEQTGLIVPIGAWVLETACRQLAAWRAQPGLEHMQVRVNVSTRELVEDDFRDRVVAVLEETGVPPQALGLELTESALMSEGERLVDTLDALRARGVKLLLDDFGTGFSSLSRLHRLPLDVLKIDRAFVVGLGDGDAASHAIADAVIRLGDALGLTTVAEGVETEQQRETLLALGCRRAQGFLFSRPLAPDAVPAYADRAVTRP
jgi:diguanylate cyclase (GGDEF)-like protein/PAS domain S-box-containing protein